MRVAPSGALALLLVTTLGAPLSAPQAQSVRAGSTPSTQLTYCATKADQASLAAHSKSNSFAPHSASHSRVYGVPIQSRILKSHAKKKPQLTSTPLPDATTATSSSGG
jgi:hypothetical protein